MTSIKTYDIKQQPSQNNISNKPNMFVNLNVIKNLSLQNSKISGLKTDTIEFSSIQPKNKHLDIEKIKKLDVLNLRRLNETTLSGGTFEVKDDAAITELKEAGIKTIIDLRADGKDTFGERCKSKGLNYHKIPFDDVYNLNNKKYFHKEKGKKTIIKEDFVKLLREYFNNLSQGNTYVGCHYGIDRTNMALIADYLLNPQSQQIPPKIVTWPGENKKTVLNKNIKAAKKIYKSLNEEQKKELNLPLTYEEFLKTRIASLIKANNITSE